MPAVEIDVVDAICWRGVLNHPNREMEKMGLVKYTGNQHNESWGWSREELQKMNDSDLLWLWEKAGDKNCKIIYA